MFIVVCIDGDYLAEGALFKLKKMQKDYFQKIDGASYTYKLFFMVENIALLRILTQMIAPLQLLLEEGHYLNKLLHL
jgi:hypothetical protein